MGVSREEGNVTCGDYFNISWLVPWCCRKGLASRSPKVSSCLTLGTELSKETGMLTKQETTGKGARARAAGWGSPEDRSTWLAVSVFMVMGVVSKLSRPIILLGPCLVWLTGLPCGLCVCLPGWIPVQRLLEGWQDILWGDVSSLFFGSVSKSSSRLVVSGCLAPHGL